MILVTFRGLQHKLPKGSRLSSTPLPGLWWAMSRHWLSCRPWEEMNIECHISISLRWLGTSGLKMITTPLESFMIAGQHDSNLYENTSYYHHITTKVTTLNYHIKVRITSMPPLTWNPLNSPKVQPRMTCHCYPQAAIQIPVSLKQQKVVALCIFTQKDWYLSRKAVILV